MSGTFQGTYYDGRSSQSHAVAVLIEHGNVIIEGEAISRAEKLSAVSVSGKLGLAPRKFSFADGAAMEIPASEELERALGKGSLEWVARLESRWAYAVAALVVTAFVLIAGYLWGLPAASRYAALRMPESASNKIGEGALELLDEHFLSPSRLGADVQQRILGRLRAMQSPAGELPSHRVVFRSSPRIGAKALALPNGVIVVTDELVKLAASDEEVLAVLGHELGHIQERHALRSLLQGSVVAIVVAWYAGDVSSIAVGIPAMLLQTGYSRDFEREADAFGARFMAANGLPPENLGNILRKLDNVHGGGKVTPYLSTHPATEERAKALRNIH
ncbi:MAG: M48 family metallopeptidase [Burkholderiales bacterium]